VYPFGHLNSINLILSDPITNNPFTLSSYNRLVGVVNFVNEVVKPSCHPVYVEPEIVDTPVLMYLILELSATKIF
jgi:hypothetical protein